MQFQALIHVGSKAILLDRMRQQYSTMNDRKVLANLPIDLITAEKVDTPILIDEMTSYNKDQRFVGRRLTVVIVTPPVAVSPIITHVVVEDARRFAMIMAICNVTRELRATLAVGAVIEIQNPRCNICSDFAKHIRIEDISLMRFCEPMRLCWMCLGQFATLQQCIKCKTALYCSTTCQKRHWIEFDHKTRCGKRNRYLTFRRKLQFALPRLVC